MKSGMAVEGAEENRPASLKAIPIMHRKAIEKSGANKRDSIFEKLRLLKKRKPGTKSIRIIKMYAQKKLSHI